MIYLDNNATTRVADEVLAAMTPFYREVYGNAHAIHSLGRSAHDAVEESRDELAQFLGCDRSEVIFTSCGTEGNAMVIRGLVDRHPDRRKVVTTSVEHPSVLALLRALERERVIELAIVPVDTGGAIDLDRTREAIDERTLLVSVMLAQNETGVLHPVARIAELAHARGAQMHVDAVQAAGKVPLDQRELGADFVTISGHKYHAPKGVGALTIRRGLALQPLWLGGGQELGMRSGTEPVPSIVGLAAASRLAREALGSYDRVRALRDELESSILARVEETSVNGGTQPRLGNTANISFHDVAADEMVRALDAEGICSSAGAACHSGTVEPSSTMKAMGKPLRIAMGAVRFSLSRYTTAEEIDRTVETVANCVLRSENS
ncbi:MAG TPA: cysteine desulfurase family protein [Thermoanaerobaculia bacterium]|jgi:cysteine desulfurase|nr:cysteine desulfurase family protein [Thermoanaerobaculia bacterium]